MKFQLRLLQQAEAQAYRELRLQSYLEDPFAFSGSYNDEYDKSVEDFQEELLVKGDPPEWFVLGAYESDRLIGFVKFQRDERSKAIHKSMVHAMFVDPAYRKQQVGKMLIDELIERAKKMEGLEQIHLWVLHSEHSISASNFYKKCGFESQGPVVKKDLKVDGYYIDAEYMVMYL